MRYSGDMFHDVNVRFVPVWGEEGRYSWGMFHDVNVRFVPVWGRKGDTLGACFMMSMLDLCQCGGGREILLGHVS